MSKSRKLPALMFYPGDWKKDLGVQSLEFFDRHVWFEMLLLMHDSEQRGVLILNGLPMSEDVLARLVGLDKQTFKQSLSKIINSGVCDVREDGAIINRRMVKDTELSSKRSISGLKGGNPNLVKQNTSKVQAKVEANTEDEYVIEDEDEIEDLKKNSPPKPPPLEIQTSKYFEVAKAALVPDNDPSIQSDNRYTNAGRKPLVKYPKIWLSIFELADTLEQYEISGIPIDERNYHHKAFKTVQSKLETYEQEGKATKSVSCYSWLTNWAMHEVLESIIKTNRLKKSEAA